VTSADIRDDCILGWIRVTFVTSSDIRDDCTHGCIRVAFVTYSDTMDACVSFFVFSLMFRGV